MQDCLLPYVSSMNAKNEAQTQMMLFLTQEYHMVNVYWEP